MPTIGFLSIITFFFIPRICMLVVNYVIFQLMLIGVAIYRALEFELGRILQPSRNLKSHPDLVVNS
jgi:hypothetical protein